MQNDPSTAAERLAINCFFNALLREWPGWLTTSLSHDDTDDNGQESLHIPLVEAEGRLLLKFEHKGIAGRHLFENAIWQEGSDGVMQKVSFIKAVQLVSQRLREEKAISTDAVQSFLERVENSLDNTRMALEQRQGELEHLFHQPTHFAESEQALLAGHSIHPVPKSRTGMDENDTRRYSPEFGQSFALRWFAVRNEYLASDSTHGQSFAQLTRQLAEEDPRLGAAFLQQLSEGYTLFPAHPWQARQWQNNDFLAELLAKGAMIDLGASGSPWRATSSMRSIHAPHASFMLKFSLSVKLTNYLRHLLPKEVVRGKEIHKVLNNTAVGEQFQERFEKFTIMTEPAHGAIKSPDGQVLEETMVVFRENPFQQQNSDHIELLATLTQDNPYGDCRLVNRLHTLSISEQRPFATCAREWFSAFLKSLVEPLLTAQADFGLLFGAHQQNLLLDLTTGYPTRAFFRDCQGTGYSPVARQLLADTGARAQQDDNQGEHHVETETGNRLFTYYLLINSVFGVTGALASSGLIEEAVLLADLRHCLEKIRDGAPRDSSCLDYMLDSEELWAKGNFFCCFQALNENTLKNPLAIYHPLNNPLYPLRQAQKNCAPQ